MFPLYVFVAWTWSAFFFFDKVPAASAFKLLYWRRRHHVCQSRRYLFTTLYGVIHQNAVIDAVSVADICSHLLVLCHCRYPLGPSPVSSFLVLRYDFLILLHLFLTFPPFWVLSPPFFSPHSFSSYSPIASFSFQSSYAFLFVFLLHHISVIMHLDSNIYRFYCRYFATSCHNKQ